MADLSLRADCARDNAHDSAIEDLAASAQTKLYEVRYLLDAIDRAADDAEAADLDSARIAAIDAIMVLCRLAKGSLAEAQAVTEQVEAATVAKGA